MKKIVLTDTCHNALRQGMLTIEWSTGGNGDFLCHDEQVSCVDRKGERPIGGVS